ncbi:MAG: GNAT family N-acetyltransferase [Janibacter sp.]
MSSEPVVIRPATPVDDHVIGSILAQAFAQDPQTRWLFDLPGHRERHLPGYYTHLTRWKYRPRGLVQVAEVDHAVGAAALWLPPDAAGSSMLRQLALAPRLIAALGRRLPSGLAMQRAAAPVRPRAPHWYLGLIATAPSQRGHGLGSALLRHQLADIDAAGLPTYLESSSPANVPVYEHFGFSVCGQVDVPDGAPELTAMWRPAGR